MPLKNRDGTVYKLRGPNPLMEEQKVWEDFQVHNLKFQGEVAPDEREIETISSDFKLKDDFLQSLHDSKPVNIAVVESPAVVRPELAVVKPVKSEQPAPVVKPEQPKELAPTELPRGFNKTFMYCLPATLRDRRDSMYGTKYQTIQYGQPFSCEAVVVGEEDMTIKVWTSVEQVTKGSIIYPKKSDGGVADAQRWWRVQDREDKKGGWLLTGHPSDETPSFDNVQ